MKKALVILAATFTMLGAHAQIGKAANEATDAAQHKVDQKQAESEAKKSGPVGKAVNDVKAGYHKNRADASADKAKESLKNTGK